MTDPVEEDCPICNSSKSAKEQFAGPAWQSFVILIAALLLVGVDTTFRGISLQKSTT